MEFMCGTGTVLLRSYQLLLPLLIYKYTFKRIVIGETFHNTMWKNIMLYQ